MLACTDGLDGWLARRDGTTRSGAFLDPLADKILVIGGFAALGVRGDFGWIPVAIRRRGARSASPCTGRWRRGGASRCRRQLGKWKAFFQFAAVGVVPPAVDGRVGDCPQTSSCGSPSALTVLSALDMLRHGWRQRES